LFRYDFGATRNTLLVNNRNDGLHLVEILHFYQCKQPLWTVFTDSSQNVWFQVRIMVRAPLSVNRRLAGRQLRPI